MLVFILGFLAALTILFAVAVNKVGFADSTWAFYN